MFWGSVKKALECTHNFVFKIHKVLGETIRELQDIFVQIVHTVVNQSIRNTDKGKCVPEGKASGQISLVDMIQFITQIMSQKQACQKNIKCV